MALAGRKLPTTIGMVLFVLAVAVGAVWSYGLVTMPSRQTQLVGPSSQQPVLIVRDEHGVPLITAANLHDASYALGYAHAQDRLWQMMLNRRIAQGRLAELIGDKGLDADKFLRTLGVYRRAQQHVGQLPQPTLAWLQAYSDGINAFLRQHRGPLPPEFEMLRDTEHEPWTPADSYAWQTMLAWDLGGNWVYELVRLMLAASMPTDRVHQLLPAVPGDKLPALRDLSSYVKGLSQAPTSAAAQPLADAAKTWQSLASLLQAAPPSGEDGVGSNNWVVAGSHAVAGQPMLANDPHLGLSTPSVWYLVRINTPELQLIGGTTPGLPTVLSGRNQHVAWGLTNTGSDTQDLYLERLDPHDAQRYQTPNGYQSFVSRVEMFNVRGAAPVHQTVRESRHGPVISDVSPMATQALQALGGGQRYVLAMRWAALEPGDMSLAAALALNQATDADGVVQAARMFHAPQQNIVYADRFGRIGTVSPGRIPLRKPGNDLYGMAPAPGWDARYDWDGWVPFDQLPQRTDPPQGWLATANQKVVIGDKPLLTFDWSLPYRFDRIEALLAATPRHDLASMQAIQADVHSGAVRDLLPLLLQQVPKAEPASPSAMRTEALQGLQQWLAGETPTGLSEQQKASVAKFGPAMAMDLPWPLIATAWIDAAAEQVFADEVGSPLWNSLVMLRGKLEALRRVLADNDGSWCDDRNSAAAETCAQVVDRALTQALVRAQAAQGSQLAGWSWGQAHAAEHEHRPFGKVPKLATLFNVRVPSGGDAQTVNVGRHDPRSAEPFLNRHSAGFRAIHDLASGETWMIATPGQSGHLMSRHYGDLAPRWSRGELLKYRIGQP